MPFKHKTSQNARKSALKQLNKLSNKSAITETTKFTLILFANQLFDTNTLISSFNTEPYKINPEMISNILLIHHPLYAGYYHNTKSISSNKKYNFNPLKIIYHIAGCNYYYNEILINIHKHTLFNNNIKIDYIKLQDFNNLPKIVNNYQHQCLFFDTLNQELNIEIQSKYKQFIMLDNPTILTGSNALKRYYESHKGRKQTHSTFYKWQKKRLNILTTEQKAYDIQQKIPKDVTIPSFTPNTTIHTDLDKKYLQEGISEYYSINDIIINNNNSYHQNPINIEQFIFPITHEGSKKALTLFLKYRFSNFAKYQDSIVEINNIDNVNKNEVILFHAGISPMMNLGLLLPFEIINEATHTYKKQKGKIDKAAYESFIRQIIGWREYQYYIYSFFRNQIEGRNYFNNQGKLTTSLYNGTTGIKPLDDSINIAFKYGYLHHIPRLMIVANLMNLCMINPKEVFRWFMEFSLDSYEWVMVCNVYSMGLWSDGGIAMRKPYIASNSYIAKMSNYPNANNSEWGNIWYALFYNFVSKKKTAIKGTYYAGMIKHWNNKSVSTQNNITKIARNFINNEISISK